MNVIIKQKRGVSPLIATILLIAFAVALGAVVMSWGRSVDISGESDSIEKCAETSLKVDTIEGVPQVLYSGEGNNGFVEFTIENNGNQDISGLIVWVVGEKETMINDLGNIEIKIGYPLTKRLDYNFNKYGNIKKVKFIPKVSIDEEDITCAKNSLEQEKISKSG
jgi:flagellin-like protein